MLHRREFLKGAAALSAPLFLPAGAFARARANDAITLGFIGMGIRGRNLMRAGWLGDDACRIIAVCDVDTNRREAAKAAVDEHYAHTDCAAYNDYRDLLARDDIDAVVICTPDHWHAIQAIEACRAGKDVYCEKPLTLTIHEAKACIDAARTHDAVFQTGSQQRTEFEGRFRTAC
jgi:predicted dehydrogenase